MRRDSEDWHTMRRRSSDQSVNYRGASYQDELGSSAQGDFVQRRNIGKQLAASLQTASRLRTPISIALRMLLTGLLHSTQGSCSQHLATFPELAKAWSRRWRAIPNVGKKGSETKLGRRKTCIRRRACLSPETKVAQRGRGSPSEILSSSRSGAYQAHDSEWLLTCIATQKGPRPCFWLAASHVCMFC